MDAQTIIGVCALWGAFLSTILGVFKIRQYLEDRKKLKISLFQVAWTFNPDTPPKFFIEISNPSNRRIKVKNVGIGYYLGGSLFQINPERDKRFPFPLESGDSVLVKIEKPEILKIFKNFSTPPQKEYCKINAYCSDGIKSYHTNWQTFDIDDVERECNIQWTEAAKKSFGKKDPEVKYEIRHNVFP